MTPVDNTPVTRNDLSLRELTTEVDGVRGVLTAKIEGLTRVVDERDRRYEDRFKGIEDKTNLALMASDKAVTKSEMATEKRFDSVNEFRGSLKDQAANLLPRAEADAKFNAIEDKLEEIKKSVNEKNDDLSRQLANLRESRSGQEGKSQGIAASWVIATTLIFILLGIVGLLAKLAH